jgi:outer membrane protein OmpA-like peptidoglycan-associated protein
MYMKQSVPLTIVMMGALLGGGCATKKYVRNTVSPVSGKLDQVSQKTDQQGQTLDQTRQNLDQTKQQITQQMQKDETQLSATNERAMAADNKAGQAMSHADQANQHAEQVGHDLGELRGQVANLDDYKPMGTTTVLFKFGSDKLATDAKQQLDQMVTSQNQYKRYFIAVEGFTDRVGSADYNEALSRRRADAVVEYLVGQHNIPVYRIHMVGLGKIKPVDEAKNRAARAKNRRVEVTVFSADQGAMAMNNGSTGQSTQPAQGNNGAQNTPSTNPQ